MTQPCRNCGAAIPKRKEKVRRYCDRCIRAWHGRNAGSASGSAKLNEGQFLAIRASSALQRELATQYGVSQSEISRTRSQRLWRHV